MIPTYNEAENITLLLPRLAELYPDPNLLFLVVDDESPDGTGRLAHRTRRADFRHRALGRDHAFAHGKRAVRETRRVVRDFWTFRDARSP